MAIFSTGSRARGRHGGAQDVVAVDVGSGTLRILSGRVAPDGQLEVTGFTGLAALVPGGNGISRGAVIDMEWNSQRLAAVLERFTQNNNGDGQIRVNDFCAGVPGCLIRSCNESGSATVQTGQVTAADCARALENARAGVKDDPEYGVIHVIEQNYRTPISADVINPVGQYAKKIEVFTHVIACNRAHELNLRRVLTKVSSDLRISSLVYNGVAAAEAVLAAEEKDLGVCLIDLGAETIDVAVYDNKRLILSFGLEGGGVPLTQIIAKRLGISMRAAETIKINQGYADPQLYLQEHDGRDTLIKVDLIDPDGSMSHVVVSQYALAEIIREYLQDLFARIHNVIDRYVNDNHCQLVLGAGFVLTGGMARLRGIGQVVAAVLNNESAADAFRTAGRHRIRIGVPRGFSPAKTGYEVPELAVGIGLLRYGGGEQISRANRVAAGQSPAQNWLGRLWASVKAEF